VNSFCYKLLQ